MEFAHGQKSALRFAKHAFQSERSRLQDHGHGATTQPSLRVGFLVPTSSPPNRTLRELSCHSELGLEISTTGSPR